MADFHWRQSGDSGQNPNRGEGWQGLRPRRDSTESANPRLEQLKQGIEQLAQKEEEVTKMGKDWGRGLAVFMSKQVKDNIETLNQRIMDSEPDAQMQIIEKLGKDMGNFYGEHLKENMEYMGNINDERVDRVLNTISLIQRERDGNLDEQEEYAFEQMMNNRSELVEQLRDLDYDLMIQSIQKRQQPMGQEMCQLQGELSSNMPQEIGRMGGELGIWLGKRLQANLQQGEVPDLESVLELAIPRGKWMGGWIGSLLAREGQRDKLQSLIGQWNDLTQEQLTSRQTDELNNLGDQLTNWEQSHQISLEQFYQQHLSMRH